MSRKSTFSFEGTRAQFTRYRDARPFHGWVERFFGSQIVIQASTDRAVEIGDGFRVELCSANSSAVLNAELVKVLDFDTERYAYARMLESGSSSQLVVALSTPLELRVVGPAHYAPPTEDARFNRVGKIRIEATDEIATYEGIVSDISKSGIGILIDQAFPPKSLLSLEIHTELGLVRSHATVRYCVRSMELAGHFRVGVHLSDMSRLDGPRWLRLIREVSGV